MRGLGGGRRGGRGAWVAVGVGVGVGVGVRRGRGQEGVGHTCGGGGLRQAGNRGMAGAALQWCGWMQRHASCGAACRPLEQQHHPPPPSPSCRSPSEFHVRVSPFQGGLEVLYSDTKLCKIYSFAHCFGLPHVLRVVSKEGESDDAMTNAMMMAW